VASGTEWVAVDWGTSNVRAWGIAGDGSHTFAVGSDKGMGKLARADFPSVLNELIGGRVAGPTEVIICGMAGARQGWMEAPYVDTPADLHGLLSRSVRPDGADVRLAPRILPGVAQRTAGREDVMRGEETQLLGLLALRPGFEGIAVLPGTHSKWVEIRGGKNPHWTGATNSPSTFGHFGGAGTFAWVDPAVGVASLALTDRPFDDWAEAALALWPAFSDAVLDEASA